MGRPIKAKWFGVPKGTGVGGESLSSITYTNRGSAYSQGLTATVAASPIGGVTGTITLAISTANGRIDTATISGAGTGYTTAPTITLNKPANVVTTGTTYFGANTIVTVGDTTGLYVGMAANVGFGATTKIVTIHTANANVVMSAANTSPLSASAIAFGDIGTTGSLTAVLAAAGVTADAIQANAWVAGGSMGKQADIVSQRSARTYKVNNTDGSDVCRLVPTDPTGAGEMAIKAVDSDAGEYWVLKLEGTHATLIADDGTQFSDYQKVPWTFAAATEDTTVKLNTNA